MLLDSLSCYERSVSLQHAYIWINKFWVFKNRLTLVSDVLLDSLSCCERTISLQHVYMWVKKFWVFNLALVSDVLLDSLCCYERTKSLQHVYMWVNKFWVFSNKRTLVNDVLLDFKSCYGCHRLHKYIDIDDTRCKMTDKKDFYYYILQNSYQMGLQGKTFNRVLADFNVILGI